MAEVTPEDAKALILRVVDEDVGEIEVKDIYTKAATNYEQVAAGFPWTPVVVDVGNRLQKYMTDRNQRILDIGAGTGLLGQELKTHGFTNVDALDMNLDMLKLAIEKKVYKNIIVGRLGGRLDIPDKTYDAVVGSGLFLPGHATPECFPEMIRILKPGALFVCNVAERWKKETPEINAYTVDFEAKIQQHVKSGEWVLEKREVIENYTTAGNGIQFYCRKA